jgi:branched-subunit amino acid transport protein
VSGNVWLLVAATGVATVVLKSFGPALLGGRDLPRGAAGMVALLAPSLLAALIAVNTFADGRHLTIDARAAGLAAAAVALLLRAPVLLVVVIAAVVTGVLRAVGAG